MGRKAQFDREALARAGLRLTRRDAWSAVTFASVAAELGVTPMALYRVVASADELRRLVADHAAALIQPASTDERLLEILEDWAVRARNHLRRFPGLTSYVMHEWTELPRWLAIVEAFLAAAARENLTGATAVYTVNAVFSYVLARVQLEEHITPRRRLGPVFEAPEQFPCIHAERKQFQIARSEEAFQLGLEALIIGLRSRGGLRRGASTRN